MKRTLPIFLCIVFLHNIGSAFDHPNEAKHPEENVLRPMLVNMYFGPMIGIGYNLHLGDFITTCNCEYSGGTGFGPTAGLFAEYPLTKDWSIYGGVFYQDLRAEFTKNETRLEYAQDGSFVNVNFERNAGVTISYIDFQANAKWRTGFYSLYVSAGPSIGFLQSNHIKETEKILTPGFVFSSNRTNQTTFLDGDLPEKSFLRAAVHFAAGYDFMISPRFIVMPELGFQLPITTVTSNDNNWRASVLIISVFVKIGL